MFCVCAKEDLLSTRRPFLLYPIRSHIQFACFDSCARAFGYIHLCIFMGSGKSCWLLAPIQNMYSRARSRLCLHSLSGFRCASASECNAHNFPKGHTQRQKEKKKKSTKIDRQEKKTKQNRISICNLKIFHGVLWSHAHQLHQFTIG